MESLKKKENKRNIDVKLLHSKELPELQYSKILAVNNMASNTYAKAKEFILNMELDIMKSPLISSEDDPAFKHFIRYNDRKTQIKRDKRNWMIKSILFGVLFIVIIFFFVYLISITI